MVFELLAEDNPANIANTGEGLPLHMDLLYYESPPGLSLLHCLRYDYSVIGGESLLLDCYPILEDLRNNYPEQFHTLTRVPATFQSIHHTGVPPTRFIHQVPHVVLGHHEEIVAVNWCPIAEGALQVSPVDVEPYYQAYLLLAKLFNTSERLLQFRLLPGQLISFNNRRILHGRNSFYSKEREGVRHFEVTNILRPGILIFSSMPTSLFSPLLLISLFRGVPKGVSRGFRKPLWIFTLLETFKKLKLQVSRIWNLSWNRTHCKLLS
ncbi:gamma-butyrobetaine dioxygenase-like isoform X2 [Dysidea avara]